MRNSLILDKLNLNPLTSKFIVNKGDIDVNPNINVFNYSNNIPPVYTGEEAIGFPNPLRGVNPYSIQKFYSKRTVAQGGFTIFAKIPFAEGANDQFIKPYRSGFNCIIYFQSIKNGSPVSSLVLDLKGSFPTTITGDPAVQTTKTNLDYIIENEGDFEMQYFPENYAPAYQFLVFPFSNAFLFIGRNPGAVGNNDSNVDNSSTNYIYIGGLISLNDIDQVIAKTIFTYV